MVTIEAYKSGFEYRHGSINLDFIIFTKDNFHSSYILRTFDNNLQRKIERSFDNS